MDRSVCSFPQDSRGVVHQAGDVLNPFCIQQIFGGRLSFADSPAGGRTKSEGPTDEFKALADSFRRNTNRIVASARASPKGGLPPGSTSVAKVLVVFLPSTREPKKADSLRSGGLRPLPLTYGDRDFIPSVITSKGMLFGITTESCSASQQNRVHLRPDSSPNAKAERICVTASHNAIAVPIESPFPSLKSG